VADDPGRHRCHDGPAVRGQPTLAAQADHVRAQHHVLDQEIFIALEARAGGDLRRDDPLLINGEPPNLTGLGAAALPSRPGLGALLHAAGPHLGPALHPLQLGDLSAQLGHGLRQGGVLRQQALGQSLKLAPRQV
jgi:hypothetical protein